MRAVGSSAAALTARLGLKDGQAVAFVRLPDSLSWLADAALLRRIEQAPDWRALPEGARDVIHLFTASTGDLRAALPVLHDLIQPDGVIWVFWPAAGQGDLTETTVRAAAAVQGMAAGDVCALDGDWSGLSLTVRAEARADHVNAGVTA